MNRKGFTLIEVLAVIVLLAFVLLFTFPSLTNVFKNSKLKSEEAFLNRLSQSIDSYVTLNIGTISFSSSPISAQKIIRAGEYQDVTVYQGIITVNDLITDNIISSSDYVDPANKEVKCNISAQIEVYKDSDYVYCHKMKLSELNCLSDTFKSQKDLNGNNDYTDDDVIDTCSWEIK